MAVLVRYSPLLLVCLFGVCSGKTLSDDAHANEVKRESPSRDRWKRELPEGNRAHCSPSANQPAIRLDTTARLAKLRQEMAGLNRPAHAYIIPMEEQHQSEYVSEYDKRVRYISGFSGSAGTAVVLSDQAALWTDGRYFLQADDELDCNWILMRQGQAGVPTIPVWLVDVLPQNSVVAADPKVINYDKWTRYQAELAKKSIELVEVTDNLVDRIWVDGRPAPPNGDLLVLGMQFAGVSWEDKVKGMQETMKAKSVDLLTVTALDETAWLYNLRGEDVKFNPVFTSYALLQRDRSTLYLRNHTKLIAPQAVRDHLQVTSAGRCLNTVSCVQVKSYDDFYPDLESLSASASSVWLSPLTSYAVFSALGPNQSTRQQKAHIEQSPVRIKKARKNPTEITGMKNSHTRDSAALIEFVTMLGKEVKEGKEWSEISAATGVAEKRRKQLYNMGLSFPTISGVGRNGAVIHYIPRANTNRRITTSELYLLDSGGQYLDGTTDVTRTFHFGTPSDYEKEAYTRVLMGTVDLAALVWPNGSYGRDIDAIARQPLWAAGLDYRHDTGHGIGAYLNVHEGPGNIALGYRPYAFEEPIYDGMFFSDEPGFYEDRAGDNNFGVRLETILMVKRVNTEHEFGGKAYLGFEAFTLVPFENKLIKYELLNDKQRQWLNDYNMRCREEIADVFFKPYGKNAEYDWVYTRTAPIPLLATTSSTNIISPCLFMLVTTAVLLWMQ